MHAHADERRGSGPRGVAITLIIRNAAVAWFFFAIGCYTVLAPLDGPVAVGAAVLSAPAAVVVAASIVIAGILAAVSVLGRLRDPQLADSRVMLALWLPALIVPAAAGFDPARSFSLIGLGLLSAAAHLAIVRWWGAPGLARALLRTAVGGGAVLALAALVMLVTHQPRAVYAANLGRATGVFITPNQCAAWLVPFTALAAGVALCTRGSERWVAATAGLLGAAALAATFSLGGWLGGTVALVVGLWWLGRRRWAAAAAATIALAVIIVIALPGVTHHRASERFVRLDALRAGVRIARTFPLVGVGPLAYPVVYPAFRVPSSTEDAVISEHPHNVVLSLLVDTGLAGFAAIAAGWWRIGRAVRAAYRTADPQARRLTVCICAGVLGRFVHGAVDLVGVLELCFVWMPFTALALAVARDGVEPA